MTSQHATGSLRVAPRLATLAQQAGSSGEPRCGDGGGSEHILSIPAIQLLATAYVVIVIDSTQRRANAYAQQDAQQVF